MSVQIVVIDDSYHRRRLTHRYRFACSPLGVAGVERPTSAERDAVASPNSCYWRPGRPGRSTRAGPSSSSLPSAATKDHYPPSQPQRHAVIHSP